MLQYTVGRFSTGRTCAAGSRDCVGFGDGGVGGRGYVAAVGYMFSMGALQAAGSGDGVVVVWWWGGG